MHPFYWFISYNLFILAFFTHSIHFSVSQSILNYYITSHVEEPQNSVNAYLPLPAFVATVISSIHLSVINLKIFCDSLFV